MSKLPLSDARVLARALTNQASQLADTLRLNESANEQLSNSLLTHLTYGGTIAKWATEVTMVLRYGGKPAVGSEEHQPRVDALPAFRRAEWPVAELAATLWASDHLSDLAIED